MKSVFTLWGAIRAMLLVALVAVLFVIMQSCQAPKTGMESYATGSLKKLTALQSPPPQPNMTFKDSDGEEMQLSDYRGKVILVNAWATWCPPCVAEMPSLNALQKMRGGDEFQVLTISMDRTAIEAQDWLNEAGLGNLRGWHDSSYEFSGAVVLPGFPTTILYNRDGRELARVPGEVDWTSLEALAFIDHLTAL